MPATTATRTGSLLTVAEAARRLGVDQVTVHRAVNAGALPTVRLVRRRYVPSAAVDELLAGRQPVTSEGS